jgi:hypothetical protein
VRRPPRRAAFAVAWFSLCLYFLLPQKEATPDRKMGGKVKKVWGYNKE